MPTLALPARRLEPADLGWATALLATCATDHPVLNYCCTGTEASNQKQWLLTQLLQFGLRYGRVYANADASALVVWVGPSHSAATLGQLVRTGLLPAALWRLGWAGTQRLRYFLVATTWLRQRSAAATHAHYLLALAVQPSARGQGRGRRLLQATLSAMQAAHAPCYLDVQRPAELGFFQQLGFRVLGQCPAGREREAPTSWGLLREGRP